MIAYAAIDLRAGRVVQLVGGRPEEERVSLPDPPAAARRWVDSGFARLHVVDLDAALGDGDNLGAIETILDSAEVPVQVGGGVRDQSAVERLLAAGAATVIVGTRAVADRDWLSHLAAAHPGRLVVAADVKGERVVTHGWRRQSELLVEELLERLSDLPLAGVLVTDVDREGRMEGVDGERFAGLVTAAGSPLLAAGGINSIDDLRTLERAGVAGAVIGMALYTGAIDPRATAREFCE